MCPGRVSHGPPQDHPPTGPLLLTTPQMSGAVMGGNRHTPLLKATGVLLSLLLLLHRLPDPYLPPMARATKGKPSC